MIGVMPEDFQFPDGDTKVWRPPQVAATGPAGPRTAMLAQLAGGVSLEAAASKILPLMRQIRARYRDNAYPYELVGVHQELSVRSSLRSSS